MMTCDPGCAQAIFQSARAFVASRAYPREIEYSVRVSLLRPDGGADVRTYRGGFDRSDRTIFMRSISAEEAAHPVTPRGIDIVTKITIGLPGKTLGAPPIPGPPILDHNWSRPASDPDVLGTPFLTPTYAFNIGLAPAVGAAHANGELREIGRSSTVTREYDATFVGEETIAGEPCRHITLIARKPSPRSRLRELWIAESDGAPLQARVRGNFTTAPWTGLDWTVTFRRDGDALYLDRETSDTPVRLKWKRSGRVAIAFEAIVPADARRDFLTSLKPGETVVEPD